MERLADKISIIKYILLVVLLFFIINLLRNGDISNASMDQVASKVEKSVKMDSLSLSDNRMIKRLYGINANDYEAVNLYVSDSNMNVEEILIVRLRDTDQSGDVEAAVQRRLDKQLESFEGYGPEQCKLLEDHILDIRGNYILFVVHEDAKAADKAFQRSL